MLYVSIFHFAWNQVHTLHICHFYIFRSQWNIYCLHDIFFIFRKTQRIRGKNRLSMCICQYKEDYFHRFLESCKIRHCDKLVNLIMVIIGYGIFVNQKLIEFQFIWWIQNTTIKIYQIFCKLILKIDYVWHKTRFHFS